VNVQIRANGNRILAGCHFLQCLYLARFSAVQEIGSYWGFARWILSQLKLCMPTLPEFNLNPGPFACVPHIMEQVCCGSWLLFLLFQ